MLLKEIKSKKTDYDYKKYLKLLDLEKDSVTSGQPSPRKGASPRVDSRSYSNSPKSVTPEVNKI